MPWVRFDDCWYDDPSIVEAGDDGGWLWIVAVSWSARNLTDGWIPSRQPSRLTTIEDPYSVADHLVEVGLFRQDDERGGWTIANYHKYQPTREEVLAKREADSARKRKGRDADSARRPRGIQPDSTRPGPGPVGKPLSSQSDPLPEPLPVDRVMDEIAQIRLDGQNGVRSPKAWLARCRENLPGEVGDEVARLVERFDASPRELAEVVEGKRDTRWLKRRPEAGAG